MAILVTGGAGYIGSHMVLSLLVNGYDVIVIDNLSNSSRESVRRVEQIAKKSVVFYDGDIRDRDFLDSVFGRHEVSEVLHFAGLKSVGESVLEPLKYYDNNVSGTLALCEAMNTAGVRRLVFSSSATVYGDPASMPIHEGVPTGQPTNPYGRSKLMVEEVLKDLAAADSQWSIALLRYFNPVGAHVSGKIGEDPFGIPNNLVPFISQVVVGRREALTIYGNDYPTPDGTGVRDYIHVEDLVEGHVLAMRAISRKPGVHVWNLGTGRGYSVLDMIETFKKVTGKDVPYVIAGRRDGDVAECWADPSKALDELGWKAGHCLSDMVEDTWRWQKNNPNGYS
ncbi:UDP-glucose 4-epimerase GalE [Halomonas sp. V046]|uniref:UDP-glucose 4-epimerase GalE n=1 Tax=Halomonas sp. V046 TaxID=3459611 RepID=UPI004043D8B3